MAGKPWYNNGQIEIQRGVNEIIPDGFVRGRLPFADTALQNIRLAQNWMLKSKNTPRKIILIIKLFIDKSITKFGKQVSLT